MRQPLTLAVAQPTCVSYDVTTNAAAHAAAVRSAGAFPELSLTGYELDAAAIGTDDPRLPDRFAPGRQPTVLDVDGWRLGLAVCKDTGIPQHASDTAALDIDVYVAGVMETANDAAVLDERADRVIAEHQVWVAVASFAGATGGGYEAAAGRSAIWMHDGTVISRAGPEPGAIARATLS